MREPLLLLAVNQDPPQQGSQDDHWVRIRWGQALGQGLPLSLLVGERHSAAPTPTQSNLQTPDRFTHLFILIVGPSPALTFPLTSYALTCTLSAAQVRACAAQ